MHDEEHDGGATVRVSKRKTIASGFTAAAVSANRALREIGPLDSVRSLRLINQPDGFDCPGCAWPERRERHTFEFCENGVKAVAEEADHDRCGPEFFAAHSIEALRDQDDFWLGKQGRLTHPMLRRAGATHYEPVGWHDALDLVAHELSSLASPDEAIFYTSGRTSNEAAYLYQLMVRAFGTNTLPECSNMCHEATSVALTDAIGIGKGSVTFDDFDRTDLVIVVGQNPGTNHPRMLTTLEEVKQRGGRIIAVNPLPEAGLIRFKNPQKVRGIVGRGTELADLHLPVRVGGDQALFRWLSSRVLASGAADTAFIDRYTSGFDDFVAALSADDPAALVTGTGLSLGELEAAWELIRSAPRIIVCWAMGITQHRDAVPTVRDIVNFALVTGNLGRSGAGLAPIRGHSNVQGDRTMGIWDRPDPDLMNGLRDRYGFEPPTERGFDAVSALGALRDGKVKVVVSMGGNLARVLPDSDLAESALLRTRLTVHISTKLNRSHVVPGEISLILPALGRTELDEQLGGMQFVTVEDSFGIVHSSRGTLTPASAHCRSEVSIVCGLGRRIATVPGIPWSEFEADYDTIRDDIAAVVPGFDDFNRRVRVPGGFMLPHPPRDSRTFTTVDGRARFHAAPLHPPYEVAGGLVLQTLRSHDQFNSTIYGLDDRYRGVEGGRRVVFVNPADLERFGFADGDLVDLVAVSTDGTERRADGYRCVPYATPRGNAAAYYPETNVLLAFEDHSAESGMPSYKSIPIRLERSVARAGQGPG